jgi:tetratricopeptide (TPR) repeat protein
MLETMRQYGVSELKKQGEIEEAHGRHTAFFVTLAEKVDNGLRYSRQKESLNLLDSEHENLRAALGWSIDNGETDLAFRLVAAMGWYWFMRGHWGEAARWLTKVLKFNSPASQIFRAKAIYRAGGLELIRGNLVGTVELVEEASQTCRAQGDEEGLAWCLNLLGQAGTWRHENIDEAFSLLSESAEIFDSLENDWGVAWSLRYLGQIAGLQGNYKQGVKLQKKALRSFKQIGDTWNAAHSLYLLGIDAYRNGDFQEAKLAYEACQEKCRLVEDKVMAAHSLRGLAQLALHEGKIRQAEVLFEEALEALKKIGDESCAAGATRNLADVAQRKGEFERAGLLLRQSLVSFEKLGIQDAVAGTIEQFASLAATTGRGDRAARLLGAADIQLGGSDSLPPTFKVERQKLVASLRKTLGDQIFEQLCTEGAAMSLQEAVAFATEDREGN